MTKNASEDSGGDTDKEEFVTRWGQVGKAQYAEQEMESGQENIVGQQARRWGVREHGSSPLACSSGAFIGTRGYAVAVGAGVVAGRGGVLSPDTPDKTSK